MPAVAKCETTRTADFDNDVYKILTCRERHEANPNATWVCPVEGGHAFPTETLCVCNATAAATTGCGFNVAEAKFSGVYTLEGFGGERFDAYLDVDEEMDMVWMMVMGINHAADDSRKCNIDVELPLSTDDSYASSRLEEYMPEITTDDIDAVRFYCDTNAHSRKVHFYTQNDWQKGAAIDGDLSGNKGGY